MLRERQPFFWEVLNICIDTIDVSIYNIIGLKSVCALMLTDRASSIWLVLRDLGFEAAIPAHLRGGWLLVGRGKQAQCCWCNPALDAGNKWNYG